MFWRHHFRRYRRVYAMGAASAAAVALATTAALSHHVPTPVPTPVVVPTQAATDLGVGCGKERWDVKTLSDPLATSVNRTPVDTTISALRALPAPASPTSRVPTEELTFRVHATVYQYKEEADSDIHLAIKDAAGNTMIAELVRPVCVPNDRADIMAFAMARNTWLAAHPVSTSYVSVDQPVTLVGVAFFDRIHGQAGVAPNGIELHPVLSLVFG